jgi:hypothetical protein
VRAPKGIKKSSHLLEALGDIALNPEPSPTAAQWPCVAYFQGQLLFLGLHSQAMATWFTPADMRENRENWVREFDRPTQKQSTLATST